MFGFIVGSLLGLLVGGLWMANRLKGLRTLGETLKFAKSGPGPTPKPPPPPPPPPESP